MPQNDSDFDEKFEQALAAYADPGDAGHPQRLTARVLAAVEGQRRKRNWWFVFGIAAPALACLLLIAIAVLRQPEPALRPAETAMVPASAPAVHAPVVARPRMERVRGPAARSQTRTLPKLDQFPAPAPLTEQERLLVNLAAHTSPEMQQDLVQAQQQAGMPLHIAELNIAPLNETIKP
jgi:hypothetical protein